jgi:hypothetical protein
MQKQLPSTSASVLAKMAGRLKKYSGKRALVAGLALAGWLYAADANAQISGNKAIPGDYATISAAIANLNSAGVGAGGVTFNVAAGYTETAANLTITATGTSANPIVFQKSGTGANPKITADAGTSTTVDGIIKLSGVDYITFDAIDLEDPATNTTTTTQMEWGYAILKASNTNGSQFVTIKNCAVTLQRSRTAGIGIYGANHTTISTTALSATGATADVSNSNNKFFSNTINNAYIGIRLEGMSTAAYYDLNNEIGVSGGNIITNFGGSSTAANGISSIYQDNFKIANNNLSGGTGTTTTLYGIFTSTAVNANTEIYNNTISLTAGATTSSIYGISNAAGGTGTNNLIKIYGNTVQNSTYSTATSGIFHSIYSSASAYNIEIYNNTVKGISKPGTGIFYGIYQFGAIINNESIYNNIVTDINSTGTGTFYLIYANSSSTTKSSVYNNTVKDVTAATAIIYGISTTAAANSNIYNNNIYGLSATAASSVVYGLNLIGGTTINAYNNFISDLKAPASTNSDAVRGISVSGSTTTNLFYNTIYLNASSSSATTFGSSGIFASTTPTVEIRNNIIVNASAPGPTGGLTAAYRRSSTTLTTYATASNTNLFYAGTPSANRVIFTDGTNSDITLGAYKSRVTPRDGNSVSGLPPFLNITTAPFDLHISTTVPTQVEGTATPVTTPIAITTDFDGNTRNASNPDMGADEGSFVPQDLTPPAIAYTPLSHTLSTTADRSFTATISDASGIRTTGSFIPRVYYRKNNGAYFSRPGILATNAGTSSTWDFTIVSADMGTLTPGDVISYFVVAQDMANPDIVGSSPAGVVATDVNTITTPPATPNTYLIQIAYTGTLNVGTSETITSLTNTGGLFDVLNNNALGGNLTINITSDLTAETGLIALNQTLESGAGNYTLTIQPGAAANRTISGSFAGGLIRLNGADRVTIDGNFSGTGKFLTFANTSTATNTATIQVISLGTGLGAVNNTVKNTNIAGGSNSVTSAFAIFAGGASISTSGTAAEINNLTISNNNITKAYYAIYARGVASTGLLTGLNINNNTIGSNAAADYVTFNGVNLQNTTAPVISGNTIFNLQLSTSASNAAIDLGQNNTDAVVTRNNIFGLRSTSTSGFGSYGINISSGTGNTNMLIANNMISDIITSNYSSTSSQFNPFGIRITGGTNLKIYHNSISLTGTPTTGSAASMSAPIVITSTTVTGLDIRNNIFANTVTGLSGTKTYAIYAVSGITFGTINNNDYFAPIIGYLGTEKATLADWQLATTQDANSKSVNPDFVSATNLHTSSFDLNNNGTPISGVTTDFDGETRNTSTPDIGADEFNLLALDLSAISLVTPTPKSCFSNAEPVTVTIRNVGSAAVDFTLNPATVTVNVSGAVTQTLPVIALNNNSLNGGSPLAPGATLNILVGNLNMTTLGTYTFNGTITTTGDSKIVNNAMNPVNLTVVQAVAGTATANQTTFCQSGIPTLNLTGSAGGDIKWQAATSATGPFTDIAGAVGTTFTPATAITQTTYYQAVATCGTNIANSNVVTVNVNDPQVVTAPSVALCGPGTATLTATPSSGAEINWFSNATGGTALANGNTYSPSVSATTTYYAEASVNSFEKAGKLNTTGADGTNTTGGLIFNAAAPFTLDSVVVYSAVAAGGNLIVNLTNSAGTVLQTATINLPPVTGRTAIVVPLNFNVPAGTGLKLVQGSSIALSRDYTASAGITYPYISTSKTVTITDGTLAGYYYFFFRWSISNKCIATSRTAVVATVNSAAATPTISAGGATNLCTGGSVTLTATSTTTGATYQWFNNGTLITGATSAAFTANAAGSYTVIATANNCPSVASAATIVTVNPTPAVPTIGAGGSTTFCSGGSVVLTATSATTGVTYSWFLNGNAIGGATNATYTANAAGNYTVVATSGTCTATSTATAVTVNAAPAVPTISAGGSITFCTGGSVTLTAASTTTGATFTWFLNGNAISAATNATYTANAAGNYTVVATSGNCTSTSTATVVTVNATPATPTITQNGGVLTSSAATGNQWYLNGTLIPGATGQVYTTTANGNYSVIATANGCPSAASAPLNMLSTGLAGDLAGAGITVYPNPNQGKFEVKLTGYNQKATIYLFSLTGQLIRSQEVKATTNEVITPMHIENLAAGTYLLKVTSDKGVKVERLIVE